MKIWGKSEKDEYLRCGAQEMMANVMECRDEAVVQWFKDAVEKLGQWMLKVNTDPNIWVVNKDSSLGSKVNFIILGPDLLVLSQNFTWLQQALPVPTPGEQLGLK